MKSKSAAEAIERAFRTKLAMGAVGIEEQQVAPRFSEFCDRFVQHLEAHNKEKTRRFYLTKLKNLRAFAPLNRAPITEIDAEIVSAYVSSRRAKVCVTSVNHDLRTLRRALNLGYDWKVIHRCPRIRLLPGEIRRDFVLDHAGERAYLQAAPQPLKNIATLLIDTGLRIGEAVELRQKDVRLDSDLMGGTVSVRRGKSRSAERTIPLTKRAASLCASLLTGEGEAYLFANGRPHRPLVPTSLNHAHRRLCNALGLPKTFVLHSLRHTYCTRLGEAENEAFTIMKLAGHSSVAVSQRYVHMSQDSTFRALERLERFNSANANSSENVVMLPQKSPQILREAA